MCLMNYTYNLFVKLFWKNDPSVRTFLKFNGHYIMFKNKINLEYEQDKNLEYEVVLSILVQKENL